MIEIVDHVKGTKVGNSARVKIIFTINAHWPWLA